MAGRVFRSGVECGKVSGMAHPLVIAAAYEGYAAGNDKSVERCKLPQFRHIDPDQYRKKAAHYRAIAQKFRDIAKFIPPDLGAPVCQNCAFFAPPTGIPEAGYYQRQPPKEGYGLCRRAANYAWGEKPKQDSPMMPANWINDSDAVLFVAPSHSCAEHDYRDAQVAST